MRTIAVYYEVLILTRIREERDRIASTKAGIIEGVSRTGRLVTGAALILFRLRRRVHRP